ncbi:hypothetical protein ACH45F_32475 [Catenuloplanes sp. NPDC020197]|uniref:Uncharacterized protein n=1 Tax=Catenuloplanes niger TaxID=587534 RepID=A0AAE3ZHI9_9ACTN|nr:hypothetical protein [Catenuloplanes niger]MDR7320028.1 hypothetical protein [Catenuloplanes niger]
MSSAPPADYVAFVDRRLPALRAHVAREVPAPGAPRAEVLTEVLSGLAGRWAVLRAAAVLRGRATLTDRYLDRAVHRAARGWRERQIYPVDLVVWDTSEPATRTTWSAEPAGTAEPAGITETARAVEPIGVVPPARDRRVSVALRRAAVLDSTVRPGSAALAEASIAWWHAYESRRRISRIIRLTLAVLPFLLYLTARG